MDDTKCSTRAPRSTQRLSGSRSLTSRKYLKSKGKTRSTAERPQMLVRKEKSAKCAKQHRCMVNESVKTGETDDDTEPYKPSKRRRKPLVQDGEQPDDRRTVTIIQRKSSRDCQTDNKKRKPSRSRSSKSTSRRYMLPQNENQSATGIRVLARCVRKLHLRACRHDTSDDSQSLLNNHDDICLSVPMVYPKPRDRYLRKKAREKLPEAILNPKRQKEHPDKNTETARLGPPQSRGFCIIQ